MSAGAVAAAPAAAATADDDAPESHTKQIGIIQPPPDMKSIVEKTAAFVAKNGPQFEARILTNERNTTKFAFLQPGTPYYPYYQMKLREGRAGLQAAAPAAVPAAAPAAPAPGTDAPAEKKGSATIASEASVKKKEAAKVLKEPAPDVYTVKPPGHVQIPSLDLDIIKLTAQYVALNGRSFLNGLLTRESRNPQFDFLKGHHYLFGYFTMLVEAYSKVVNPPDDAVERLNKDTDDRADILTRAFEKLDWEAHVEKERQDKEDKVMREKETVASIDWHDFKIVETIDFADDEDDDLPPPLSEEELRELRLQASTAKEKAEAEAQGEQEDMDMDEGADMDVEDEGVTAPSEMAAAAAFDAPAEDGGPMKIVKNHMKPGEAEAIGGKSAATAFMISPITGQQVPVEQMAEHMRIALLDPKWKEKSGLIRTGEKEDTLAMGDDVGRSLAKMAAKRKDIFGTDEEVFGGAEKKQAAPAKVVWDGSADSRNATREVAKQASMAQALGGQSKPPAASAEKSVADIIARAEAKVASGIGAPPPKPPPAAAQPAAVAGAPPPPATVAHPTTGVPPPAASAPPAAAPPKAPHAAISMAAPPPGLVPAAPGSVAAPAPTPTGVAVPPPGVPPAVAAAAPEEQDEAKRAKATAELVPADQWLSQHPAPVSIKCLTPQEEDNAKFNFDGRTVTVDGVAGKSSVKDLKNMLKDQLGGLAMSNMKLTSVKHGVLKDAWTIAQYNMVDGENLMVALKTRGGKK